MCTYRDWLEMKRAAALLIAERRFIETGDVESSDAARQSSFDDDSDMNRSSAEVSASNDAFGARRRAGFFQSLGAGRRGGIKKKQCVAQSSSTDTDAQDRNRSQLRSHPRQRNSYAAQERLDADADGGPSVKPPERADKPGTTRFSKDIFV